MILISDPVKFSVNLSAPKKSILHLDPMLIILLAMSELVWWGFCPGLFGPQHHYCDILQEAGKQRPTFPVPVINFYVINHLNCSEFSTCSRLTTQYNSSKNIFLFMHFIFNGWWSILKHLINLLCINWLFHTFKKVWVNFQVFLVVLVSFRDKLNII